MSLHMADVRSPVRSGCQSAVDHNQQIGAARHQQLPLTGLPKEADRMQCF